MSEQDEFPERIRHDRHVHGGLPQRLDDDQLAELTEEERAAFGVDPYDPDEVPPATDAPLPTNITESDVYQEERAEVERELEVGELRPVDKDHPFPPTRYE
jgi:hypothetical protein